MTLRSCERWLVVLLAAAAAAGAPGRAGALGLSVQGEYGVGELGRDLNSNRDTTAGVILGLQLGGPLQLELEYQRSNNDVSDLVGSVTLKQEGLMGHVRLDVLNGPFDPFIYGGVGWVHYSTAGVSALSSDQVVLPIGAGLEIWLKPIVFGVRGEYQWIPNDVMGKTADYWKVVGTIGLRVP